MQSLIRHVTCIRRKDSSISIFLYLSFGENLLGSSLQDMENKLQASIHVPGDGIFDLAELGETSTLEQTYKLEDAERNLRYLLANSFPEDISPLIDDNKKRLKEDIRSEQRRTYSHLATIVAPKVEDVDKEKIKRVNDDLDTLLVFAGLFSSVLTTFLVSSFAGLSEDNTASAVFFLRQISQQSGNTTTPNVTQAPPFDPPPFAPATSTICVNVLWFLSLIVALATASFAILVKQWLREFLSFDPSYAPQSRLRVRHHRYGGLREWKVFEIAGSLPFLLLLALALFFLGLSVYASSTHWSVGVTSLFMTSTWGSLVVTTILAPLTSSRCPYRTTMLNRKALMMGRRWVAKVLPRWTEPYGTLRRHLVPGMPPLEEDAVAHNDLFDLKVFSSANGLFLSDEILSTTVDELLRQPRSSTFSIFRLLLRAIEHRRSSGFTDGTDRVSTSAEETAPLLDKRCVLDLRHLSELVWNCVIQIAYDLVTTYLIKTPWKLATDETEQVLDLLDCATLILFAQSSYPQTPRCEELRAHLLSPTLYPTTCKTLALGDFPRMWHCLRDCMKGYDLKHQASVVSTILYLRDERDGQARIPEARGYSAPASSLGRWKRSNFPSGSDHDSSFSDLAAGDSCLLKILSFYLHNPGQIQHSDFDATSYIWMPQIKAIVRHKDGISHLGEDFQQSLREVLLLGCNVHGTVEEAVASSVFTLLGHHQALRRHLKPSNVALLLRFLSKYLYPETQYEKLGASEKRRVLTNFSQLLEEYASQSCTLRRRDRGRLDIVQLSLRLFWIFQEDQLGHDEDPDLRESTIKNKSTATASGSVAGEVTIEEMPCVDQGLRELWKKLWQSATLALTTCLRLKKEVSDFSLFTAPHHGELDLSAGTAHDSPLPTTALKIRKSFGVGLRATSTVPTAVKIGELPVRKDGSTSGFAGRSDLAADCLDIIASIKSKGEDGPVKLIPEELVDALHAFLLHGEQHWIFETTEPGSFYPVKINLNRYPKSLAELKVPVRPESTAGPEGSNIASSSNSQWWGSTLKRILRRKKDVPPV